MLGAGIGARASGEDMRGMDHEAVERVPTRRRRSRQKHRRKSRRMEMLLGNLGWAAGGVAVGLPLLAILIYFASR
jgi:hypothetical protein